MAFRRSILAATALCGIAAGAEAAPVRNIDRIEHIVVIYLENRSFDNLYGLFPGADGIKQAMAAPPQVDQGGKVYATLPQPRDTGRDAVDPRFPADLPNKPFDMGRYVPSGGKTGDLRHRFYQNQAQINGGRNDGFVAHTDAGGLVMGYYDGSQSALWKWAQKYTLSDRFFMAGFGGSFFNHINLACACAPHFPNAPEAMRAVEDANGRMVKDGTLTPDGYAVNTIQSVYQPHHPKSDPAKLLPPQDAPTLGDRLSAKGISWAWYSGGFNDAVSGKASADFQYHHQPYAYFRNFGDGTPARAEHLKDGADFVAAIEQGTLPTVAFYKPIGVLNQHAGYANIDDGDQHVAELLVKLERSPQWAKTAVIVTYDENGGFYDHVAPPKGDRWGPGSRIPALFISPFTAKGKVDHTPYTTLSILKMIETRFGLEPLNERDANAPDLSKAFE
jgi:phospholipase C